MAKQDLSCDDPYATLLAAGKLVAQADALERRADALEALAMAELESRGFRPDAAHTPNRVTCFAFGGKADGRVQRMYSQSPALVHFPAAEPFRIVDGEADLSEAASYEYGPAVALAGDHGLAALMAPAEDGFEALLERLGNEDEVATRALVRVMVEGASLNARGAYVLVERVRAAVREMQLTGQMHMVFIAIK